MHAFPHNYRVTSTGSTEGSVEVTAAGASAISTYPPPQFGGPEGHWSPESLLVASVADCFIFTFRAVARASKFEWKHLQVEVEGELDRVEKVTSFTKFQIRPKLQLAASGDAAMAKKLLEKSERNCLITSSLKAEVELNCEIVSE